MLKLHTTQPYTCSYLPEQLACSEIVTPDHPISAQAYGKLIQAGFRRSGHYIYRPCCDHCHACLSVRIPVKDFSPKRTQRRVWKQHANLLPSQHPLHYQASHFTLYQRYQAKRHAGGGMDLDCREQYHNFLLQSHVNSRLIEFHDNHHLCMISIIDLLPDGLSSVYTFFDADTPRSSYGTYSILWQIELCRELGLDYLYLGYWIKANRKMRYKTNFQPLEVLIDGCWYPLDYDFL